MGKIKFPFDLEVAKYLAELRAVCFNGLLRQVDGPQQTQVWFEICDYETLNVLAAFGGFPDRYDHYRFAMEYMELSKGYIYGLQKIYEMVINNDPVYAYLLSNNGLVDQKLVINHVYGHADFFFNNVYFNGTNRRAIEMMANHAQKIEAIKETMTEANKEELIELWIDCCLSVEDLIDRNAGGIRRVKENKERLLEKEEQEDPAWSGRFPAKDYMDDFINPAEELVKHQELVAKEKEQRGRQERKMSFPAEPAPDIFKFLIDHAPLDNWQREIAQIIWEEAIYFLPQAQTKIMNEGWASYWHSKLMTSGGAATSEILDFADHHSGTVAQQFGRLNPYRLGLAIFKDIEYRWNTARHGEIWTKCDEVLVVSNWDQFVAFKNIYENCGGDIVEFGHHWHEFCCFWRALKEGRGGFPKDIYNADQLLSWWDDYRFAEIGLKKLNRMKMEALAYVRNFLDLNKRSSGANTAEKKTRRCQIVKILAKGIRDEVRKRRIVWDALTRIKKEYEAGQLLPEDFAIPQIFFSYAARTAGIGLPINGGQRKIFEVRKFYCDLTFIQDFLTEEIAHQLRLFTYDEDKNGHLFISSRNFERVRNQLLDQLTNWNRPQIEVADANLHNGRKLLLRHKYDNRELEPQWAQDTLARIYKFWHRPVFVETVTLNEGAGEVKIRMGFNGKEFSINKLEEK